MDRHTAVGTGAFQSAVNSDFLENNCVDDPVRLCEFQKMEGRILKTVDSVYQDVDGLEDCKRLCLTTSFRCHSFDFGDTGDRVCRLSHHAAATLTHIEEPYLEIPGSSTYELSSCYNVTIDCRSGDMVAKIKTSKIFNGKIYAKGSPNTCVSDIEDALEFELRMSYNDIDCNVERDSASKYSSDVVIQHHDMIVTSADLGLSVHCQYDLTNKSVSNRVDLTVEGDIKPALEEGSTVDSPNVIMRVANRNGDDISDAAVGDMLQLRFEIVDRNSPYEIFVRDLVAMDGSNTNNITLLDGRGCPTEISIMRPLLKTDNTGKVLGASFDAFKFPTSDVVQFRALVTPCLPTCEPVVCDVLDFGGQMKQAESYGRKKRDLSSFDDFGVSIFTPQFQSDSASLVTMIQKNPYTVDITARTLSGNYLDSSVSRFRREAPEQVIPEELLVVQSIKISDKFGFRGAQAQRSNKPSKNFKKETNTVEGDTEIVLQEDVSGMCINMVGLVLACSVFLVAQLVIIVAWTAVWHRRRRSKLEEPLSPATTTESLRQLYDSGYPRRI
ncbi:putative PAN domain-containing protein 7 [Homarus americanus]|uniref:Putative PAN domain-containing protein 7 n=2 Tax=Homarus americanus TaxID=6706 RepID=A0A8J5TIP9_HOMAM|nr:putative PAN domain-containing protein 7 [Homarus americanus]